MSKILISSLGSGKRDLKNGFPNYETAKYKLEKEFIESNLLAKILIDHYHIEKVYLLGTPKSLWELVYSKFNGNDEDYKFNLLEKAEKSNYSESFFEEHDLDKLQNQLNDYLKSNGSRCVILKYGIDEQELWENFDQFMNLVSDFKNGDEIYLDITHSFRSLSFFSYLMARFAEKLKNRSVRIVKIFYGNLDIIREVGYAPVVDLKMFFDIDNLTTGVGDLINYGHTGTISDYLQDEYWKKAISDYSASLNVNNVKNFRLTIDKIKKINSVKFKKPFNYVAPVLHEFVAKIPTSREEYHFLLKMAELNMNYEKYTNAYVLLTEAIINFVITRKYNTQNVDEESAKKVKKFLHEIKKDSEWWELAHQYKEVNEIRKHSAHTLSSRGNQAQNDINSLQKYLDIVKKEFLKLEKIL